MRCVFSFLVCLGVIGLLGCGGGPRDPLARVTGKVTCKGTPVTGASITFSPFDPADPTKDAGKAANANLNEQGEFVLGTHSTNDGAVVGMHRFAISFEDANKKYPCPDPVDVVFEVKSSPNHFEIDLDKVGKKK